MLKYKNKLLIATAILAVLVFTYWWGGNAPGLRGWHTSPPTSIVNQPVDPIEPEKSVSEGEDEDPTDIKVPMEPEKVEEEKPTLPKDKNLSADEKMALASSLSSDVSSEGVEKGSAEYSADKGMAINEATGKDRYLTDPVPEGKPIPVEPQDAVISGVSYTAVLSVRCDTILDNIEWLDREKIELVPEDGIIFPATEVVFYQEESVFNLLHREMKKNSIHMEFENTPMYNSAYIQGINNLYEFDVGELSGWMYKVNGWFPNYGASRYQLQEGDVVEWVYTCNLGVDVGGYYAVGE